MGHGKVLIEEGPTVELRQNPYLELCGERLDADFVGVLRAGELMETGPSSVFADVGSSLKSRKSRKSRRSSSKPADKLSGGDALRLPRLSRRSSTELGWHPAGGSI